jgi:integrase
VPDRVPQRIKWRGRTAYYYRRVPAPFRDVDDRQFVLISLKTGDARQAAAKAAEVERELETLWRAKKNGQSDNPGARYAAAIERVRLEGFDYRSTSTLAAEVPIVEILRRLARLEQLGAVKHGAASPAGAGAAEALLGGAVAPVLTLSTGLEEFFRLTRDLVRRKSAPQLRHWQNVRRLAVNNLIALVGDKPLSEITRADALALHGFWQQRVLDEGYNSNSANKNFGQLSAMFDLLEEKLQMGLPNVFQKLMIKGRDTGKRAAFDLALARRIAIDPDGMAGLNDEARGVVLAMVETGMSPSEICGLGAQDIRLDVAVPHVRVRAEQNRELKTDFRVRDIPLVGVSLQALTAFPAGFPRYRDKAAWLSSLVNKSLRRRGLLPTPKHSLYSFRHFFQERLNAAAVPDRIQAELMGHKFGRPSYGEVTLEVKRAWLEKIAITNPNADGGPQIKMEL